MIPLWNPSCSFTCQSHGPRGSPWAGGLANAIVNPCGYSQSHVESQLQPHLLITCRYGDLRAAMQAMLQARDQVKQEVKVGCYLGSFPTFGCSFCSLCPQPLWIPNGSPSPLPITWCILSGACKQSPSHLFGLLLVAPWSTQFGYQSHVESDLQEEEEGQQVVEGHSQEEEPCPAHLGISCAFQGTIPLQCLHKALCYPIASP